MSYSINKLAKVAGVSVRALHYYDEVGLLSPKRDSKNSYRVYSEEDLLILQQIHFYKELDFPLDEIKKILNDKNFDVLSSLMNHKKMILARKKRIDELVKTIDKTILKLTKNKHMNDDELYDGFSKEELTEWNKEAKERWGNTEQYKQSVGKYESLTREQKLEMKKAGDELMKEIVANMDKDPGSPEIQALVQRHYDGLKFFYEPNLELYKGLADMYAGYSGDERFRAYFEKYDKNLPEFMRTAMHIYCDRGGEGK